MPTLTAQPLSEVIDEVKGAFDTLDVQSLAAAVFDRLDDEERRRLALAGIVDAIRRDESRQRKPRRSGHANVSGRFAETVHLPGRGILANVVRMEDGRSFQLGDLTLALLDEVVDEYDARIGRLEYRRAPYEAVRDALKRAKKKHVRDLGEERVERIWDEANPDV